MCWLAVLDWIYFQSCLNSFFFDIYCSAGYKILLQCTKFVHCTSTAGYKIWTLQCQVQNRFCTRQCIIPITNPYAVYKIASAPFSSRLGGYKASSDRKSIRTCIESRDYRFHSRFSPNFAISFVRAQFPR